MKKPRRRKRSREEHQGGHEGGRRTRDTENGDGLEHPEAGLSPLESPLKALEALRAEMEPTKEGSRNSVTRFKLRPGQRM